MKVYEKTYYKKQLEIMKILWSSDKPLIASEILKRNDSLNINTVQGYCRKRESFFSDCFTYRLRDEPGRTGSYRENDSAKETGIDREKLICRFHLDHF